MKFLCKTREFLQALQLVSRAIGSQQALPILGNILLEVKSGKYTVSATDLELSIVTYFPADIEVEGSITIPAKAIINFAQYNEDNDVLLEVHEGSQLRCTSKHSKTIIAGEASTEYPTIASIEKTTSFILKSAPLLRALHLVTFASSKTSLRPVLSGVYFHKEKEKLTLVATDSYRLSEYILPITQEGEDLSCIIPTKILEELKLTLGHHNGDGKKEKASDSVTEGQDVSIALSKQQIEIQVGNTRFLSRLIEGKFPDYHQIIPTTASTTLLFPTHDLLLVAKRMHYFAKEMNNTLTFSCTSGKAKVTTPQTQIGKDEAEIAVEMTGQGNKIALSSSYLLDFLSHISDETIEVRLVDALRPSIFRLPSEPTFLHLIMPLRLQEE